MQMIDWALLRGWQPELAALRRQLHARPETAFEETETADQVARRLKERGLEVHAGLAGTGLIASLSVGSGPSIGLRAEMDALDLDERPGLTHMSRAPGKMHACGHDGHTVMLLGAARYLAERHGFSGTVHFLFQPAEENRAGARVLIEEGLFERFPMRAIFGLHNRPGLKAGCLGIRAGPVMAAADFFELRLIGRGGHGAYPHKARDPIVAAAQVILAWQSLVSRQTDPIDAAVLSVTQILGGRTTNVIPEEVWLAGTTRSFKESVQDHLEKGMAQMAALIARAHGMRAEFDYQRRYRATVNSPRETAWAEAAMRDTVGSDGLRKDLPPTMGAEDFGWLLSRCPGAYGVIGNGTRGRHGRSLHSPDYDFNDQIIPVGVAYWVNLVRRILPKGAG